MTTPWQPPDSGPGGQPPVTPPAAEAVAPPRYGELAPPGYVPWTAPPEHTAAPAIEPTYAGQAAAVRPPRTADVAVTCVLLGLGLFGALAGIATGSTLGSTLPVQYARYDVPYTAPAGMVAVGVLIVVSHIVLYLAAVGFSVPLMLRRRSSFWVPLAAGVAAGLILWISLVALLASDPAFIAAATAAQQ